MSVDHCTSSRQETIWHTVGTLSSSLASAPEGVLCPQKLSSLSAGLLPEATEPPPQKCPHPTPGVWGRWARDGRGDRRQVVGAEAERPLQGPPPPGPLAASDGCRGGAQAAWRRRVGGGPPSLHHVPPACPNKATQTDDAALRFYFLTSWEGNTPRTSSRGVPRFRGGVIMRRWGEGQLGTCLKK